MHSSLINKIRILKPRKKSDSNLKSNQIVKSYTITNDNCHSSINLQKTKEQLPPLIAPKQKETNNSSPPNNHWVPVYIVNVPKVPGVQQDLGNGSSCEKTPSTSDNSLSTNYIPVSAEADISTPNDITAFISSAKTISKEAFSNSVSASNQSEETVGSPCNQLDLQYNNNSLHTRQEVDGVPSVNCFLCPNKFNTVQEMQAHYLENHKQKKRTVPVKPGTKKGSKSAKLKEALIGVDDCSVRDGEPKCPICSIYFKTKDEVKSHMTSVHCYKCSECQNTFYTLFQFTDHRCLRVVVRQRKPKLKKKKIKINEIPTHDKDPLSLSPNLESKKPKLIQIQPKAAPPPPNTYPIFIQYPMNTNASTPTTHIPSESIPKQLHMSVTSDFNQDIHSPSLVNSIGSSKTYVKPCNSLLEYSLEQLTSKEFNRMKLNEIIKNPNLSVNWIKKEDVSISAEKEFFSCGRCNVLCEDGEDYVEHLEECLRLSNVSLLSTINPPQRILKLKSEVMPSKVGKYIKSSINKKLLKELKSFINADDSEIFKVEEEPFVNKDHLEEMGSNSSTSNSDFYHPDIKGNISITKLTKNLGDIKANELKIVKSSDMTKFRNYSTGNAHQPMVIIPLRNTSQENINNSLISDKSKSLQLNELDHYPNISITDKSNSVTWNFIRSQSGALLSVVSPLPREDPNVKTVTSMAFDNSQPLILSKTNKDSDSTPNSFSGLTKPITTPVHKKLIPVQKINSGSNQSQSLKSEPLSPHEIDFNDETKISLSPQDFQDKYSSLELVLDEEEIKMEVEDEVVDDSY